MGGRGARMRGGGVAAAVALLLACGPGWADELVDAGRQVFKNRCLSCHAYPNLDESLIGPSLKGVVGRRVGTLQDFPYSRALAGAGGVWTEPRLDDYLSAAPEAGLAAGRHPGSEAPAGAMLFRGIGDAASRRAVIAFLKANP